MEKQQMILIRGLPGSGKSTLAKQLTSVGFANYEADMFFVREDGRYDFNPKYIAVAHEWCQNMTNLALEDGLSVVVSNTFTTLKEMRPYFEIALEFGIIPSVFLAQNDFGNVHDVPQENLNKMINRFCFDVSPLINEFKNRFNSEGVVVL